ncbi:FecCD family ABC transporter permease [Azorhizobium doebereinerae]|uniref:FecCD family ABC transporter permease n=1 Tax=Azorhizobium doebereinerae TaxID=281091 RepID=UPI00041786D8|nr:iron ABC transporter permease [Azorhizobium doebereinerae]
MTLARTGTFARRRSSPLRLLRHATLAGAPVLLVALAIAHLGFGARAIGPRTVIEALVAFDPANFDHKVVVELRMLRLLSGVLVGAALGVCGAVLQAVTRNPLGEPHVLGLNAGATLAVVSTLTLGPFLGAHLSPLLITLARPLVAAAGAAAMFGLVIALASAGRHGLTPLKVTLCGVALSSFAAALTSVQLILDDQTLATMRLWLAGDLSGLSYGALVGALPAVLVGLSIVFALAGRFNAMALGDGVASGLGVDLVRTRRAGLAAAGLLCGAAVSLAGPIGFVGLVVPHVVRSFISRDLRLLIPLSAVLGASLLLAADLAARSLVAPRELATGAVTALVGVPVFLALAARSR